MSYLDTIKNQIGKDRFDRLEKEAEIEVARALQMPLKSQYGDKMAYMRRSLLGELFAECQWFHEQGLKILPTEIIHALFRAKLLFASQDEDSFLQRSGVLMVESVTNVLTLLMAKLLNG